MADSTGLWRWSYYDADNRILAFEDVQLEKNLTMAQAVKKAEYKFGFGFMHNPATRGFNEVVADGDLGGGSHLGWRSNRYRRSW